MKLSFLISLSLFILPVELLGQNKIEADSEANIAQSLSDSAIKLWRKGSYKPALKTIDLALSHAQKDNDTVVIAKCLNNTGLIYNSLGDPVKSLFYYEQSLTLLKKINHKKLLPTALLNIGIAYKEQALYDKAIKYLYESASEFEDGKDTLKLSSALNTIGNILMIEKDYTSALKIHFQSLQLRKQIQYLKGVSGSLNNIGIIYKSLENYDSALWYLTSSLSIIDSIKPLSEDKANTLSHIGDIYKFKSNYKIALEYYEKAHHIREKLKNMKGIAHSYFELGVLKFDLEDYPASSQYLLKSIAVATEINALDVLLKCFNKLRQVYRKTNDLYLALQYDDKYIDVSERVLNEKTKEAIIRTQVAYETEKKQQEIVNLNAQKEKQAALIQLNELKLSSRNKQLIFSGIIVCILVIIVALIYSRYKQKKKHALELDILRRELHHRVNNNFQVLSSILKLQAKGATDLETKTLLESNVNRVDAMKLVHHGLYQYADEKNVNLHSYITEILNNLLIAHGFNPQSVVTKLTIDTNLFLSPDRALPFGLIVNELISNSFKHAFTNSKIKPMIDLTITSDNENILFSYSDNGTVTTTSSKKVSFGLKIIKSQISQLQGTLHTSSDNFAYSMSFKK